MPVACKTTASCPNKTCLKELAGKGAISYFVEVPILGQLATFFNRKGFYDLLQHRLKRRNGDKYSDIYDGKVYKSLTTNDGLLSSPDSISILINSDGVPVFKSSKVSIWPVYLMINELPLIERRKNENYYNIIFAGLWFGDKKPLMLSFLRPTFESLSKLEEGVEMHSPERGTFILKGALIACTCDLPARAMVNKFQAI